MVVVVLTRRPTEAHQHLRRELRREVRKGRVGAVVLSDQIVRAVDVHADRAVLDGDRHMEWIIECPAGEVRQVGSGEPVHVTAALRESIRDANKAVNARAHRSADLGVLRDNHRNCVQAVHAQVEPGVTNGVRRRIGGIRQDQVAPVGAVPIERGADVGDRKTAT